MYEGSQDITYIGEPNYRNERKRFGIRDADRLMHLYCIGKSGMGKSTLLYNMAFSDIQKGKGLAVLDPHGDLVQKILDTIPRHRAQDVVYFNPADAAPLPAAVPGKGNDRNQYPAERDLQLAQCAEKAAFRCAALGRALLSLDHTAVCVPT